MGVSPGLKAEDLKPCRGDAEMDELIGTIMDPIFGTDEIGIFV
jgi:hypothetical protein